jgi:MFS transporter
MSNRLMAYRGSVWRLLTVQALVMFILWVPIWVVFLQRKGLSLTQIGVLEAIAWVITAALEVPTGAVADRWGRKASIAMGTFLYSVAMFLILTDALSPTFLLGYALWNGSMAFVSGADSALLYDSLKADGREGDAAKFAGRFAGIQQASQGVAALAGSALATIDITLCFSISGVLALVATILVLTIREAPRFDDEGEKAVTYWNNLRTAVGIASRRPVVRVLLLLIAAFSVVPLVVYYFLLQPYALAVGLPVASFGAIVVLIQVTTVAASWLAYRAGRRFALRPIVISSAVVLVGATALLGIAPSIPSVALMLLVALVPALVGPLLMARLNDLIPSAQRATILSLSALVAELGTAGLVPLLMTSADLLSPAIAIGISALVFAVAALPLLLLWRASDPRPARVAI